MSNEFPSGVFRLQPAITEELDGYLRTLGLLTKGESILSVERAGEGNMNCVVRVRTDFKSIILKQSRPWVEKYPRIGAPFDRALQEIRFYRMVENQPAIASRMPALLLADPDNRLLCLEDLGTAGDCTKRGPDSPFTRQEMADVAHYLSSLHSLTAPGEIREQFSNREMRELNHAHIFRIPLDPNNQLDLDAIVPGLKQESLKLTTREEFRAAARALGDDCYLREGTTLVHGDIFPGCWMMTDSGLRFVDPEFSFFGRAEIDVGVVMAHLRLSRQPPDREAWFLESYHPPSDYDPQLAARFAGVEIMRRVIGVAQLRLGGGVGFRRELLDQSSDLLLGGVTAPR
ncbi:MAG: aminoglycoside phosphotransferase [Verrucomicrobia bacterium]|nr:aminoglycoside phosphotransferase [Verrucomicrobiota bacterium]